MIDAQKTWDEVRRLADELEVKIHLASLDARDQWHELEPRLAKLEHAIAHSGDRASDALKRELHEVRETLRALRENVYWRLRDDYVHGW